MLYLLWRIFMPSGHGGGGGGGGHGGSFGGGSSGGSLFGGSSGGFHHKVPIFLHFGNYSYVVSNEKRDKIASYSVVLVFLLFIFFVLSFVALPSMNRTLKGIEQDRVYYLNMIANAEEHSEYMTTATVTNVLYNEDYGKYYFEYTFTNQSGSIAGYSYCMYSQKLDAPQFGTSVQLAIDSVTSNQADSIPTDYKNFSLEDDGQYSSGKSYITTATIIDVMLGVGIVISIVAIVSNVLSSKKMKTEELTEQMKNKDNKEDRYCQYCGYKYSETDTKCPCCGGNITKKE